MMYDLIKMYRVEQWSDGRWMFIREYSQYKHASEFVVMARHSRRITKLAKNLSLGDIPVMPAVYKATLINRDNGQTGVMYEIIDPVRMTYKDDDVIELLPVPLERKC